jgi:plastocyanin
MSWSESSLSERVARALRRGRRLAALLALAGGALLVAHGATPLRAQSGMPAAGQHWHVQMGAGSANNRLVTLQFYPQTLTIDAGDSVTWTAQGNAHVVAFLSGAPVPPPDDPAATQPAGGSSYDGTGIVRSGLVWPADVAMSPMMMGMSVPTSYTLTFTAPGSYTYYCLIHPGMQGTVVVQPAGSPYPQTQAQYDAPTAAQAAATLAPLVAQVNAYQVTSTATPDGHTTWYLSAGIGTGTAAALRFTPSELAIHVGDTVVWTNTDPVEPHTVTFAGPDGKVPEPEDPDAPRPAGSGVEDGTALNHSGFLVRLPGTASSPPYQLTFPTAGIFKYECVIHDPLGMYGTIVVTPAGQ